jgi:4-hydroxy-2-oxoheptanedioate aldolase
MDTTALRLAIRDGRYVLGTLITSPSPHWVQPVAGVGLDFVFIDTEHIPLGRETVSWLCRAYDGADLAPIVRVPSSDPVAATQALDGGAAGVVAPYVETVQQVRSLRGAVKLRPLKGQRLQRILAGEEEMGPEPAGYLADFNRGNLLLLNIESVPAVEALDELLGVPGLDGVIVGPHDLSVSLGIPEAYEHPRFNDALGTIIERTRRHDLIAGAHFYGCGPTDLAVNWLRLGVQLLIYEADLILGVRGLREDVRTIRAAVDGSSCGSS